MKKYKKDSQTEKSRDAGFWKGLLKTIFILGVLFFVWFVIAHNLHIIKAKRDYARAEKIEQIADTIQDALTTYAKKNPEIGYPHQISDYGVLRNIINQYGGALPENQSEIFIKKTHYCSDSGKDYKMAIEIDFEVISGDEFFIITPKDVIRRSIISVPKSDCNAKEVDRDGQFIAYDDGTVNDIKTGLMWASEDSEKKLIRYFSVAQSYCNDFGVGLYTDWRVASIDELSTLFDKSKKNENYNHLTRLIHHDGSCVWSSDYDKERKVHAIYSFKAGKKSWVSRDQLIDKDCRVLPVRELKRKE